MSYNQQQYGAPQANPWAAQGGQAPQGQPFFVVSAPLALPCAPRALHDCLSVI